MKITYVLIQIVEELKMKTNFMKGAVGTVVDVAIGGAAMKMVGDSSMPQGIKDVTNLGIGVGIMGRAMKRSGFGGSNKRSMDW
jgi:hypothetical protein